MPPRRQAPPTPPPASAETAADRLHSAAIHLLRRLRLEDPASGLTAPRASALSVVVFGGPISLTDLAAAEQVRLPTISRLVRDLERARLIAREADPTDGRVQRVHATALGRRLLEEGRARRVAKLAAELARLPPADRHLIARSAALIERLARPEGAPRRTRPGS